MRSALTWGNPAVQVVVLVLAGAVVLTAGFLGFRAWRRSRVTAAERERRRRSLLATRGKMGDAWLVDIVDGAIFYTYAVRGVEYTASQEVLSLGEHMPTDLSGIGPVAVKYDPRNPANSIVVAEEWSGLRIQARWVGEPGA